MRDPACEPVDPVDQVEAVDDDDHDKKSQQRSEFRLDVADGQEPVKA